MMSPCLTRRAVDRSRWSRNATAEIAERAETWKSDDQRILCGLFDLRDCFPAGAPVRRSASRTAVATRHDHRLGDLFGGPGAELRAVSAIRLLARPRLEPAHRLSSRGAGTRDGREVPGRR